MELLNKLARSVILTVALVLPTMLAVAQNTGKVPVSGVVVDETGEPIVAATIYQKDQTSNGASSDFDGKFSFKADAGSTIVFSFVGFDNVEMKAGENLKVVMKEIAQTLDEVVFVGYGTQRKESVVGAISQIDNESIVNSGLTNVTQAITGKLSGVLTMQSSGKPGGNDAEIFVRGVSSWNGSKPLVMVDGVEREFNTLDPNEIASVSVLKDASATAVFGAKGANGVILVTTRSGQKGKPKMQLSVTEGFNIPALLPDHQDAFSTATALNVAYMNAAQYNMLFSDYDLQQYKKPSNRINELRYPDVDWYRTMLKPVAYDTDANFNISGGTDRTRYFISMGYKHEGSIFKTFRDFDKVTYQYDRLNYRANLDFTLTKTTTLSYKIGGDIGITQSPNSPINAMYSGSTIAFPAYYPEWVLEEIPDWDYPYASGARLVTAGKSPSGSYYGTPYNKLNIATYDQATKATLYTDLLLDQKLDFITEGLSIKGKVSFSTAMARDSESVSRSTETYYLDWDLYDAGLVNPWLCSTSSTTVVENAPYAATQGDITSYSYKFYWEGSLNYDRTFHNHHVTALALFNERETRSSASFPYRTQGIVGRFTYDFKHKYLFEGNVGYTGSEQFAPANRYGLFPSLAVGYVVSEEGWWKNSMPWFSKLKLRYSDGLVGNDQVAGGTRWLYFSQYSKSGGYVFEDSAANDTARWETAHKQDLGIEMGWLDNRLTAELDLFSEHRTDMLVDPVVTYLVGVEYKQVNKGEMKKHGYEFELGWEDKLPNGVKYNLSAMYSFSENRIINYEDPPFLPDYQKTAGKPYKSQPDGQTLVDGGYFNNVNDIHNYVAYTTAWKDIQPGAYKYLDYKADGVINGNDLHAVFGSQYPSTLFSFGGGLKYKGWECNILFYGNMGKWVNYNGSFEQDFTKGEFRLSASQADYWTPTNHDAGHATMVFSGSAGHPMYTWAGTDKGETVTMGLVGRTWRQADYFTLRDLYLGYTFNTKKLKEAVGVRSLSLYATGNNLLYFTNLIEGNPEIATFKTGYYPLMKSVRLGLKVGF